MSIRSRVRESGFFDRLRRDPARGWISGVCAGLGDFFDWNVKLVRLVFIAGFVFGGFFPAGVIYAALWYLMDPIAPRNVRADVVDDIDDRPRGTYTRHSAHRAGSADPVDLKARFTRLEQRLRCMEDCVTSRDFELRREFNKLEG